MKAFTRKARATERGYLFRTGGGPHAPPPPPQQGAIISMVENAAPVMICEIYNSFDSEDILNNEKVVESEENICFGVQKNPEISLQIEEKQNSADQTGQNYSAVTKTTYPVHRPTDPQTFGK
ncbi:unnamed protein product [Parnassius apollo]|uniref:(apollo) hypothetical protein n=1 Tax=Parnassius apollo TaxID=110799 RepID=A0A8S3XKY6_PARAO|nr:unnamed protein product [Parnassius apollo]